MSWKYSVGLVFYFSLGKNVAGLTMFLIIWHRKRLLDL